MCEELAGLAGAMEPFRLYREKRKRTLHDETCLCVQGNQCGWSGES